MAPRISAKLILVALLALLLAVFLARQAPFIYGPSYWKWHSRYIEFWRYFPAMLLCALPLFASVFVYGASRARLVLSITLLMLSMLAMQLVHIGMTVKPFSLSR